MPKICRMCHILVADDVLNCDNGHEFNTMFYENMDEFKKFQMKAYEKQQKVINDIDTLVEDMIFECEDIEVPIARLAAIRALRHFKNTFRSKL